MSLSSLRSRLAFFSDSNPEPPRDLRGKSSGAEDLSAQRWVSLRRQYPCVPHSLPTVRFPSFSSPARTSIPLWLRAIWSYSEEAIMARWMTACHWRLRMRRSCRARQLLPQPCPLAFCASNPGMDADLFHVLSNAVEELGLEWSPPDETWMNGSCRGAAKPLANELRHSSQWSTTRSPNFGMHPTRTAYVPLLPPPSLRSTVRKKKDTTACLPWMSQWPPISALPGPLAGRQKPPTRPNRVERLQLLLDEPIHRLDKRPQHFTPWRSCKCSRMSLTRTPQLLKSCTVRPTWPSVPPRWQLRRSADPWPV